VLLAIAIFAMAGDVCILPSHVHATELKTATESAGGHGEDHPDSDHSLHSASCEGLRGAPDSPAPVLTSTAPALPHMPDHPQLSIADPWIASSAASPPLFLLHAALLI